MLLYTPTSEPPSAASRVTLGDLPPSANTPDNTERVQRIKANGLACLGRIHGDVTWDDWMGVGAAMMIVTEEALVVVGALKWDSNNKYAVTEFNARWDLYEASAGSNHKSLSKQERFALREIMSNPELSVWRERLAAPERRRLNHPNAVLNRFRARAKAAPEKDRKLSPYAQMQATNIKLQNEIQRLRENGDGNVFTRDDNIKDIAAAIIGTFDGLSNKTAKVESIVRELNAWAKAQRVSA
jgi:hypothetical protein